MPDKTNDKFNYDEEFEFDLDNSSVEASVNDETFETLSWDDIEIFADEEVEEKDSDETLKGEETFSSLEEYETESL